MKIFDVLKITKFKIITTAITFGIFLFIGAIFWKDVKCPAGVISWRCGVNPFWGLMPWKLFIPFAMLISYLICCITGLLLKIKITEDKGQKKGNNR